MNKKLFIAMAVALGVSETAFADNPFLMCQPATGLMRLLLNLLQQES